MTGDIERYLQNCRALGRSEKTLTVYHWRLDWLKNFLPGRNVSDITRDDLTRFYEHLQSAPLASASRSDILITVKCFFSWLHENNRILSDVAAFLAVEKSKDESLDMPPTEAEVADLLESVPPDSLRHTMDRAILELLYGCGLRRAEVAALRLSDADFARESLLVHGKGDKDRVVPLAGAALHYLNLYLSKRADAKSANPVNRINSASSRKSATVANGGNASSPDAPLFVKPSGKPLTPSDVDNLFGMLRRRKSPVRRQRKAGSATGATHPPKGWRDIHPHSLRHAFAVHMLRNGADVRVIQELLGHEDIDMTARYLRLVKDDIKTAYDAALDGAL